MATPRSGNHGRLHHLPTGLHLGHGCDHPGLSLGGRWTQVRPGLRLPPVRAYMDDLTTLTTTKACTVRLLKKLQENIELAHINIKPTKSRGINIVKGKLPEQRFHIGKEPIPTVSEKPMKGLDHWYDASLKDKGQVSSTQMLTDFRGT